MDNILTIQELISFFESKNIETFSSAESGRRIRAIVPATFEVVDPDPNDGLMRVKIKVCHTGKNRNNSFISRESAEAAMPSFKNRPILAYIHQLDDGEWDFESHNQSIERDEDGDAIVVYQEQQIGNITEAEPFFEYDKEYDKEYVCAYGVIPEAYSRAADIIRRKGGTKNSAEICIDELKYDRAEKCLRIEKWVLYGTTLLGAHEDGTLVQEGMEGSRADIVDFSEMVNNVEQKGDESSVNKFEELLQKYNKSVEDVTFEHEGLTDEELEAKFAETFDGTDDSPVEADNIPEDGSVEEEHIDDNSAPETNEDTGDGSPDEDTDAVEEPATATYSGINVAFALTLGELEGRVNRSIKETYETDENYIWADVFVDSTAIMHEYGQGNVRHYKQGYAVNEDGDVTLIGERTEVFPEWLTQQEKDDLTALRASYQNVVKELDIYKKNELWASGEYSSIETTEEFSALKAQSDGMSFEEVSSKLESMLLDKTKQANMTFAAQKSGQVRKVGLIKSPTTTRKSRYGNLFKHRDIDT